MNELQQISNILQETVDVTQLVVFLAKVREIATVNKLMAPTYLRDFIEGQDLAGMLLAKSIQADGRAKAKLEQSESIAYLDKAADYLKAKSVKDTAEARKQYVCLDPDVINAQEEKAKTEALVALFKNKLSILRQAHDDLKKMTYGDSYMNQFEGM